MLSCVLTVQMFFALLQCLLSHFRFCDSRSRIEQWISLLTEALLRFEGCLIALEWVRRVYRPCAIHITKIPQTALTKLSFHSVFLISTVKEYWNNKCFFLRSFLKSRSITILRTNRTKTTGSETSSFSSTTEH